MIRAPLLAGLLLAGLVLAACADAVGSSLADGGGRVVVADAASGDGAVLPDAAGADGAGSAPAVVALPAARARSEVSLEEALGRRRSTRRYAAAALTLAEVSQLLWAAQGVTASGGRRTAPSAGATYPMEVFLVAASVEGLAPGVYRYRPDQHALAPHLEGDLRGRISGAEACREAPASLVLTAVLARTARKYGERAERYVSLEAGAVAENVLLEAEALGLGAVLIGAFQDDKVRAAMALGEEAPLAIVPVGRRR